MPRRRSAETMEKDAKASDLFRRGLSFRQICAEIGYASPASAQSAVRRAAAEAALDPLVAAEARQAALDRLQDYRRAMQRILTARHVQTAPQSGKILTGTDGKPLTDTGPWIAAMGQIRWIEQEENRLRDLYPPSRSRVEVVDDDVANALADEAEREIARISEEAAHRGDGLSGESPEAG